MKKGSEFLPLFCAINCADKLSQLSYTLTALFFVFLRQGLSLMKLTQKAQDILWGPLLQYQDYRSVQPYPLFSVGTGDPRLCPHACITNTLLPEGAPNPNVLKF